jgi:hypothetical protein
VNLSQFILFIIVPIFRDVAEAVCYQFPDAKASVRHPSLSQGLVVENWQ